MIGARLKAERKKRGLSQVDMQNVTGVPSSTISYNESSAYPDLEYIFKACNHWGISPIDVIIGSEEKKKYFSVSEECLDISKAVDSLDGACREKLLTIFRDALSLAVGSAHQTS